MRIQSKRDLVCFEAHCRPQMQEERRMAMATTVRGSHRLGAMEPSGGDGGMCTGRMSPQRRRRLP